MDTGGLALFGLLCFIGGAGLGVAAAVAVTTRRCADRVPGPRYRARQIRRGGRR